MRPDARPRRKFGWFLVAGGIGFLVDGAVLLLLTAGFGLEPISARVASIGVALGATWLVNRRLAFTPSSRGIVREGMRYGTVGIGSSLLNFAVYAAIVAALPHIPPMAALAAASAVALLFSWAGYSRAVFDR